MKSRGRTCIENFATNGALSDISRGEWSGQLIIGQTCCSTTRWSWCWNRRLNEWTVISKWVRRWSFGWSAANWLRWVCLLLLSHSLPALFFELFFQFSCHSLVFWFLKPLLVISHEWSRTGRLGGRSKMLGQGRVAGKLSFSCFNGLLFFFVQL